MSGEVQWICDLWNPGNPSPHNLGQKGAAAARMIAAGLPVPAGFVVPRDAVQFCREDPAVLTRKVWPEVKAWIRCIEEEVGRSFAAGRDPLLLSLRSSSLTGPPTLLNLGLTRRLTEQLASDPSRSVWAWDSYRCLLVTFGTTVQRIPRRFFDREVDPETSASGRPEDDLRRVCDRYEALLASEGRPMADQPEQQVLSALDAFILRRQAAETADHFGPEGAAVLVQAMVFANRDGESGAGFAATRDGESGEPGLSVIFRPNLLIPLRSTLDPVLESPEFSQWAPHHWSRLQEFCPRLEKLFREAGRFAFVVESGRLQLLGWQPLRVSAAAAVRIAADFQAEGLVTATEALHLVSPNQLEQALLPTLAEEEAEVARGLGASPGVAVGRAALSADSAFTLNEEGDPVVLVRNDLTPEDFKVVRIAEGVLTARGGLTSSAAVIARSLGKCAVIGCEVLEPQPEKGLFSLGGVAFKEGDWIGLDGRTGRIAAGRVRTRPSARVEDLGRFLEYLSSADGLEVRANADSPLEARRARELGATGIGLCRTEMMFQSPARRSIVQELLLSENFQQRSRALQKLRQVQQQDFSEILRVGEGLPVTVRLLDARLHDFLPNQEELEQKFNAAVREKDENTALGIKRLLEKIARVGESNPLLGQRGCRLGVAVPEITAVQVEALVGAACQLNEQGISSRVEVLVPMVSLTGELRHQAEVVRRTASSVLQNRELTGALEIRVGVMIELPRAALIAGNLARHCDFFSFGTNDLTRMTFGFSREDSAKFLGVYERLGILERDPFVALDETGVGELIQLACARGRRENPNLVLGVCGDQAVDPKSLLFLRKLGVDYISCPPSRLPAARLAAAQSSHQMSRLSEGM